jgi:hypothetical protein
VSSGSISPDSSKKGPSDRQSKPFISWDIQLR